MHSVPMRQLVQLRHAVQLRMVFEQCLLNVAAMLSVQTSIGHISASAALFLFPQNLKAKKPTGLVIHGLLLQGDRAQHLLQALHSLKEQGVQVGWLLRALFETVPAPGICIHTAASPSAPYLLLAMVTMKVQTSLTRAFRFRPAAPMLCRWCATRHSTRQCLPMSSTSPPS